MAVTLIKTWEREYDGLKLRLISPCLCVSASLSPSLSAFLLLTMTPSLFWTRLQSLRGGEGRPGWIELFWSFYQKSGQNSNLIQSGRIKGVEGRRRGGENSKLVSGEPKKRNIPQGGERPGLTIVNPLLCCLHWSVKPWRQGPSPSCSLLFLEPGWVRAMK